MANGSGSATGGRGVQAAERRRRRRERIDSVFSVKTQSGDVARLSQPLTYGKVGGLSPAQEKTVAAFEQKRLKNKIEYGATIDQFGNQTLEKKGGSNGVSMPVYALMKADVFSHNHPRAKSFEKGTLGGTFSPADIRSFATIGPRQFRAAAAEGTYVIQRGKNFDSMGLIKYFNSEENKHYKAMNQRNTQIRQDYHSGKIDWDTYCQKSNDSFNTCMIDLHNSLRSGASKYGYEYALERRT